MRVHHLERSRSHRILWLLEELGVDYEIVLYRRDPQTNLAPPELWGVSPLGKSPILEDGDLVLAESGAIIDYVLDKCEGNARLRPVAGAPDRVPFLYWFHVAEGSAMTQLQLRVYLSRLGEPARVMFEQADRQVGALNRVMEAQLATNQYIAGERFSVADIQMSYPIDRSYDWGLIKDGFPNLNAYRERLHQRPSHIRAREREKLGQSYS